MKRDHRFFEKWAQKMSMRPVTKVTDADADILIADSGEPFYGANDDGILGRWYRTGYAIDRGDQTWFASYNDYPAEEFGDVSKRDGQQTRVGECLVVAREALRLTKEAGLYNADKAHSNPQLH